jgi:hypothetical protein
MWVRQTENAALEWELKKCIQNMKWKDHVGELDVNNIRLNTKNWVWRYWLVWTGSGQGQNMDWPEHGN